MYPLVKKQGREGMSCTMEGDSFVESSFFAKREQKFVDVRYFGCPYLENGRFVMFVPVVYF